MTLTGTMLRVRKWIQRIPLVLNLRRDYRLRWAPSLIEIGPTWALYLREVKNTLRSKRRKERLRSETERWNESGTSYRPICSWLPVTTQGQLPYVCPVCKRLDTGHAPLLVFQTVGVWFSDGTQSRFVYTALACRVCGMRKPEDSPYVPREDGLRPPRVSHFARVEPSYYLSYTVTCKSGHLRQRRQTRHRETNVLLETRAEVVRLGDQKEALDLETINISPLTVDQVVLEDTHPLSYVLLPVLHEYEKERASKGRW